MLFVFGLATQYTSQRSGCDCTGRLAARGVICILPSPHLHMKAKIGNIPIVAVVESRRRGVVEGRWLDQFWCWRSSNVGAVEK